MDETQKWILIVKFDSLALLLSLDNAASLKIYGLRGRRGSKQAKTDKQLMPSQ
jgi:hypothetical protein